MLWSKNPVLPEDKMKKRSTPTIATDINLNQESGLLFASIGGYNDAMDDTSIVAVPVPPAHDYCGKQDERRATTPFFGGGIRRLHLFAEAIILLAWRTEWCQRKGHQ